MDEHVKHKFWARIRKHRVIILSILGVILVAGLTTGAFIIYNQSNNVAQAPEAVVENTPAPEPIKYYSPLTGLLVADEVATKQPVTGIMIENSTSARPQSGLKNSGVIFEAIAEGGITRFLVLYQQEKPQLIGPVRSIRLYDVEWVAAFNASVAHIGGSAGGLAEIRNGSYRDIDQFFNPGAYWRVSDRYAPHNVYTSFERLDALNTAKGYTSSIFTGFSRIDEKPAEVLDATQITIDISGPLFDNVYTYDVATNSYLRSQAGAPHLDREDGQINPKVVVAMRVDETTVFEDGNRELIITISSGAGTIFQNGTAIPVTWSKASKTDQIKFTDAQGNDVPLVRGQTWLVAVPSDDGNVTWQ